MTNQGNAATGGRTDPITLQVMTSAFYSIADEIVAALVLPEAASFTRPVFGSTRSGTVAGPRLRITYLKPFPFENP
jgi:hypothetical protein